MCKNCIDCEIKNCSTCHYGTLEFDSFYCDIKGDGIKITPDFECRDWSEKRELEIQRNNNCLSNNQLELDLRYVV